MPKRITYHITKREDGGWNVKRPNAERASAIEETQREAINKAKDFLSDNPLGQIKIHSEDGRIRTEHTYGNDPKRTKG